MIHQPYGDVHGSWRAMEELYRNGKVKAIGLSNFQPDRVMDIMLHNSIIPAVNQIETHPFCQQKDAHDFLSKNNIQIESWGPFAEGLNNLFTNEILTTIGAKYNKSVAQTVLRWLIQRGIVAIPKSIRKDRLVENFKIFDFELSFEDMKSIEKLDTKTTLFFDHRSPETVQRLTSYKLPE